MVRRSYPNTPLGWLNEARDQRNGQLAAAGHSMKWRKVGRVTQNTRDSHHYHGTCRNCGGALECGEYWATWLSVPGKPSLLRWKGVSKSIRRCSGGGS